MKRRAMILLKVFAAALLTLWFSNVTSTPYTVQAQGAIAQPPGDPTGATTGTAADVTVKDAKNPTLPEVMETVGHNKIAINFVWTLLAGFLVMFMQAGFAMVETGLHAREERRSHDVDELHDLRRSACSATGSAATRCRWAASAPSSVLGGTRRSTSEFTDQSLRQDLRPLRHARASS